MFEYLDLTCHHFASGIPRYMLLPCHHFTSGIPRYIYMWIRHWFLLCLACLCGPGKDQQGGPPPTALHVLQCWADLWKSWPGLGIWQWHLSSSNPVRGIDRLKVSKTKMYKNMACIAHHGTIVHTLWHIVTYRFMFFALTMSHSALAVEWEANGDIRDKARKLQLVNWMQVRTYHVICTCVHASYILITRAGYLGPKHHKPSQPLNTISSSLFNLVRLKSWRRSLTVTLSSTTWQWWSRRQKCWVYGLGSRLAQCMWRPCMTSCKYHVPDTWAL